MYQPGNISARHESRGADTATSSGTNVTASSSANVKGSWSDLGGVTSFAYEAITVCIGGSQVFVDQMIDVGISDGSNRHVLVADLYYAGSKQAAEQFFIVTIPVHVPAGAQLSARAAASNGTGPPVIEVSLIGHASGLAGAPGFSRSVALFTPASSRGVAVDPGGTANTKGAWAQLTASSPADIAAMFGLVGYNADTARASTARALIDIGVGAAASEFVLYPNAALGWGATRDGPSNCPRIPIFGCNVAAGSRIAARAACSINTAGDRTVDLALYGLVP